MTCENVVCHVQDRSNSGWTIKITKPNGHQIIFFKESENILLLNILYGQEITYCWTDCHNILEYDKILTLLNQNVEPNSEIWNF